MRWLVCLFYFLLVGCVSTAFSGANVVYKHKSLQDNMSDYSIPIKAWNTLKNEYPNTALKNLHIDSFHRIVLLTGQVPNDELRNQIEASIKSIPNIARIYNATTVSGPLTAKEKIHDSWITTKVKSKMIASNDLYADKIKVVTEGGIVYLIGIITQEEANIVINIAKETEGVTKVVTIFYFMTMPEIR